MQHGIIINCSFSYQKIFLFYSESEENKYLSLSPFSENFFFLIVSVIITERINIHLQLRGPFFSVAQLTLSVLHFFTADIESKVSQLPPSSIILKNLLQMFDTKGATEIDFNTFQFGKRSFQFSVGN